MLSGCGDISFCMLFLDKASNAFHAKAHKGKGAKFCTTCNEAEIIGDEVTLYVPACRQAGFAFRVSLREMDS